MRLVSFDVVYHIGTMNPADKQKVFRGSYEGHGLSVSQFPDAWREIARLGGDPLWRLTRAGNQFLDFLALDNEQRKALNEWGLANGWVVPKTVWTVQYFDAEIDETRYFHCDSEEEAERESPQEEDCTVSTEEILGATRKLNEYHGFEVDDVAVQDLLAVVYADQVLSIDGVFWDENLDVIGLTAPRAVIFPLRVADWKAVAAEKEEWYFEPGDPVPGM